MSVNAVRSVIDTPIFLEDAGEGWFPRASSRLGGRIVAVIPSEEPFYVVRLEDTLEVQEHDSRTPSGLRLHRYGHVVINSRSAGVPLTPGSRVLTHVRLVPIGVAPPSTAEECARLPLRVSAACLVNPSSQSGAMMLFSSEVAFLSGATYKLIGYYGADLEAIAAVIAIDHREFRQHLNDVDRLARASYERAAPQVEFELGASQQRALLAGLRFLLERDKGFGSEFALDHAEAQHLVDRIAAYQPQVLS